VAHEHDAALLGLGLTSVLPQYPHDGELAGYGPRLNYLEPSAWRNLPGSEPTAPRAAVMLQTLQFISRPIPRTQRPMPEGVAHPKPNSVEKRHRG
jgi:hypothetical protein